MVGTGNRGTRVVHLSKEQASKDTRNSYKMGEENRAPMTENGLELPGPCTRNKPKNSWNCQAPLPTT